MSNYSRCSKCDNFDWMGRHACPPLWQILDEDYHGKDGTEWDEAYGVDAEEAVRNYAETSDSVNEMHYARHGGTVKIRKDENFSWQVFEVTAEAIPQYYAREVKNK